MSTIFINSKQIRDAGGIRAMICPATNNLPTRMTKASWRRLCEGTQKRQGVWGGAGYSMDVERVSRRLNFCLECRGEQLPPGLEFIDLTVGENMPTKNRKGTCWNCGATGVLVAKSYKSVDGEICSTCANIYANVNQRIAAVVKAVVTMNKAGEVVAALAPDQVVIKVENETFNQIAKAVGYSGDNGQELLDSVALLTQGFDRYRQQAERLAAENTALAEQLSRARGVCEGLSCLTIDALIKMLKLAPDAPMAEVLAAVEALLAAYGKNGKVNLDSYLLDLAIEYPGIPLERIAMIREAA